MKKIKDLSLNELRTCCNKNKCENCPLNFKDSVNCYLGYFSFQKQPHRPSELNKLTSSKLAALTKSLEKEIHL